MFSNGARPPIVFISYSHDSQEHADRVLELSDHLRTDGVDCILDQYENSPPEGFPRWMDRQIRAADFVLIICTARYLRCVKGEDQPGVENAVRWESVFMYQALYDAGTLNAKFIPVLLEGAHEADIPFLLQGMKYYRPYTADVILLLVSSHFLASDFSYSCEMKLAMERQEAREALVIPIIISPTDWEDAPFASLQSLPLDGKPLVKWANLDEAFLNIALGIRRAYLQLIDIRPTREKISLNIEFRIQQGDITLFDADVVALKYAQEFHGIDNLIASRLEQIGFSKEKLRLHIGDYRYLNTQDCIRPHHVLFVGVPHLSNFDYNDIQQFSARVLYTLAKEAPHTKHLVMTLHGINRGFDEIDAFLSQFYGYLEAMQKERFPPDLEKITIVDKDVFRVQRLRLAFNKDIEHANYAYRLKTEWAYRLDLELLMSAPIDEQKSSSIQANKNETIGTEVKPHIFVAMPFRKDMEDTFFYGIQAPVRRAGFLCERVDQEAFVGDILEQVKMKIETAAAVIAELSGANPNVYLEVGYAWGKERPTIFLARNDQEIHFDIRGHRCLKYESIHDLEKFLKEELAGLKAHKYL